MADTSSALLTSWAIVIPCLPVHESGVSVLRVSCTPCARRAPAVPTRQAAPQPRARSEGHGAIGRAPCVWARRPAARLPVAARRAHRAPAAALRGLRATATLGAARQERRR